MPFSWEVIATLVALMTLFIVVLMQMISRGFGLQNLGMWVKAEYLQVGVSFLIIFFALAMQTAGNRVASEVTVSVTAASGNIQLNEATVGNLGNPLKIAKAYLETVVSCERHIYFVTYTKNFFTEFFSNMKIDILGSEAIGGNFVFSGPVSLYHYINNNIIYLVLFHYIQYNVLQFAQYTMLPIFLPIGLILRAFPVTRGAGGLVVAFALGFAFVFPISYVLIVAMMPNVSAFCGQISVMAQSPEINDYEACLGNRGEQMEQYYKLKSHAGDDASFIGWIQSSIGMFFLQAIFYPLVALIVTFTFIRQTGSLFGSDLAEIGRGLIKII